VPLTPLEVIHMAAVVRPRPAGMCPTKPLTRAGGRSKENVTVAIRPMDSTDDEQQLLCFVTHIMVEEQLRVREDVI
jgi:hypothetical protein